MSAFFTQYFNAGAIRRQLSISPVFGIVGLVVFIAGAFAVHRSGQLNSTFPLLSLSVAIWLFKVNRKLYLHFVLALWFVVPCLRRLVDFTSSWTDPSPILLAPYLATLVAPAFSLRRFATTPVKKTLPYTLAMAAVLIGGCLGLLTNPLNSVIMGVLNWGCPILFGAALFIDREHWGDYNRAINAAFAFWLAITSGYTLLQFSVVFPWDALWIINLDSPSMRSTDPYSIRAFGTLNSPGTAAFVLAIGSLWILHSRTRFRIPLLAVSLCALLTTQVRAGWLAFGFGLVLSLCWRVRHTLSAVIALITFALLIAVSGSFQTNGFASLTERIHTLDQGNDDDSANSRMDGYRAAWDEVQRHPLGRGLGVAEDVFDIPGSFSLRDSGLIEGLISLGVVGALLYGFSLVSSVWSFFETAMKSPSRVQVPYRIAVLTLLVVLPLGSTTVAFVGILLWMFVSLGIAAPEQTEAMERHS